LSTIRRRLGGDGNIETPLHYLPHAAEKAAGSLPPPFSLSPRCRRGMRT